MLMFAGSPVLQEADRALLALGQELQDQGYRFVTVTPATHQRVIRRAESDAPLLQQLFGWNRPVPVADVPARLIGFLEMAEAADIQDGRLRSRVRYSSVGAQLFVHSGFPTEAADSVFFGPDTYRFARALRQVVTEMPKSSPLTIIDIGCGSGAGGLHAASLFQGRTEVILTDINLQALRYSAINAALNGIAHVRTVMSDVFANLEIQADLILSNPPYLVDPLGRQYRHGGELGFDLSVRIVEESLPHLAPGGRLFLYTGTPVVNGVDQFWQAVAPVLSQHACDFSYDEIDPDVFGEELDHAPYDRVDRLAVVGLTVRA